MKRITIAIVLMLALFGSLYAQVPTDLVRQYCDYDASGYRLSSRTIALVEQLPVSDELSQSSDLAIIISGYHVVGVEYTAKNTALVEVAFDVVGELEGLEFTPSNQKKESYIFSVQKNDSGWSIARFSGRSDPKVYAGAMADHLLRISSYEEDLDQRNELLNLVKTLREYDCNAN